MFVECEWCGHSIPTVGGRPTVRHERCERWRSKIAELEHRIAALEALGKVLGPVVAVPAVDVVEG